MKQLRVLFMLAIALLMASGAMAQRETPVEITADGGTRFEGGLAIAEDNVRIVYEDATIFCDFAQYNPDTRDILLLGNVRIFQPSSSFMGERAVYNIDSKRLRAADFSGEAASIRFRSETIHSIPGGFRLRESIFTTDDNIQPSWHLRSRGMRLYPDDRVILTNLTLKAGQLPLFWFPYFYQSLDEDFAFTMTPGFGNEWGTFLLSTLTFPLVEDWSGTIRLDLRSERGVGFGGDVDGRFGLDNRSYMTFSSYYIDDSDPTAGLTSAARRQLDSGRYRLKFETRTFVTDDMYLLSTFTYLSDFFMQRDFFRSDSTIDPQPDNFLSLTQWGDFYNLDLLARFQVNDFYTVTERLPEFSFDIKKHPLFGSPVVYEGSTAFSAVERKWIDTRPDWENYDSLRFDTFHKLSLPVNLFGWLNVVPNLGYRGTWYSDSGIFEEYEVDPGDEELGIPPRFGRRVVAEGGELRNLFTAGIDASMKFSRTYEQVQSRFLALDGLLHVAQPYMSFNYVSDPNLDPDRTLQFDSFIPSTQIAPIDPSFFTPIDSIDEWAILRLGFRNRLLTRRDSMTSSYLTLDTFVDFNLTNPYSDEDISNLVHRTSFSPTPFVRFDNEMQLPLLNDSFTEINTFVSLMPHRSLEFSVGHRYLDDSDFFGNSSYMTVSGYLRLNENWGVGASSAIELEDNVVEWQRYSIHRDLTSWVASLSFVFRDTDDRSGQRDEFGVLLSFTLKDLPSISLPFDFDPGFSQ